MLFWGGGGEARGGREGARVSEEGERALSRKHFPKGLIYWLCHYKILKTIKILWVFIERSKEI